jgi:hypothetical protein
MGLWASHSLILWYTNWVKSLPFFQWVQMRSGVPFFIFYFGDLFWPGTNPPQLRFQKTSYYKHVIRLGSEIFILSAEPWRTPGFISSGKWWKHVQAVQLGKMGHSHLLNMWIEPTVEDTHSLGPWSHMASPVRESGPLWILLSSSCEEIHLSPQSLLYFSTPLPEASCLHVMAGIWRTL